jgi:hypothetical protein
MNRNDAASLFLLVIAVAMSLAVPPAGTGRWAEPLARLLREVNAAASWEGFQLTLVCIQDERDCVNGRGSRGMPSP